jgi:hypothetical protein
MEQTPSQQADEEFSGQMASYALPFRSPTGATR